MNLYSTTDLNNLLEENGFYFKKKLGQNFLMNEAVSRRIAEASKNTIPEGAPCLALEVGPGAGSLTLQLSKLFDKVLALEIDPHLIPVLNRSLSEKNNVSIECCDALRFPYTELQDRYPGYAIAVCSNLPYYITSELLMTFLESRVPYSGITVLIQQEAADRLCASPGASQYGAITAAVSYYAETKKLFRVGPGNFIPRPKVDSAVLQLTPRKEPPVSPKSESMFFSLIRAVFSARRKTLLNALSLSFPHLPKDTLQSILEECQIDVSCRGETLNLSDFCRISDFLYDLEVSQ